MSFVGMLMHDYLLLIMQILKQLISVPSHKIINPILHCWTVGRKVTHYFFYPAILFAFMMACLKRFIVGGFGMVSTYFSISSLMQRSSMLLSWSTWSASLVKTRNYSKIISFWFFWHSSGHSFAISSTVYFMLWA